MHRNRTAITTAKVDTPKPQSQPSFSLIQTKKVTPKIAPVTTENRNQLKKLERVLASSGSVSSNWSAPKEGSAAFSPPVPTATKYRPVYRIAAWLLSAASH